MRRFCLVSKTICAGLFAVFDGRVETILAKKSARQAANTVEQVSKTRRDETNEICCRVFNTLWVVTRELLCTLPPTSSAQENFVSRPSSSTSLLAHTMSQAPDVPAMRSMNAQTFRRSKRKTFNINLIPCPHPGCSHTFKNRSGLTQHRHAIHDFSFEIQREAPPNEMQEEAPPYDGDVEMDYQPTSGGTHHDYHLQLDGLFLTQDM